MESRRLILECITVLLGLCVVFFVGFQAGQHDVNQDSAGDLDFSDGSIDGNQSDKVHGDQQVLRDQHLGSRTVDAVSSNRVNGYEISFKTEDGDRYLRENGWSGYTWGNRSIVIKSGMPLSWTYEVCRHEVKHNVYPELNHSQMEDRVSGGAKRTCLELVYLLEG